MLKINKTESQNFIKYEIKSILKMVLHYIAVGALIFVVILLLLQGEDVHAKPVIKKMSQPKIKNVYCDESKLVPINVKPTYTTIINFPIKPDNVILGSKNLFSVEYIKNDLAVNSLSYSSKTNLFVYLLGRRCGFELKSSNSDHDNLILVRDPEEVKVKVPQK